MRFLKNILLPCTLATACSLPAFAGVVINSPTSGSTVQQTFTLSATSSTCQSANVVTMGWSFDSSSNTTVIKGQTINQSITSSTGSHTLHVKSWAPNGISCVSDISLNVQSSATSTSTGVAVSVPSTADVVSSLEALGGWKATHDTGGPGSSTGYMQMLSSPSMYGSSRQFVTTFSNNGDERYTVSFSDNINAEHFFYDTWIYTTSSASALANLEFDINQTMPNGQTMLMGVQCDGWTGNWAYTVNTGTASSPKPKWVSKSGTSCNPRTWSQYTWHHVQAYMTRNSSGYVTYNSVWLDGQETQLNATAYGAANLNWGDVLMTQFQVDGYGSSGHVTLYLDKLTISAW